MDRLTDFTLMQLILVFVCAGGQELCTNPQYIQWGETRVVECSFQRQFYGVYWYNSTDSSKSRPLVALENSEKSGNGYTSGKYDVLSNGSLVISNVSISDDHFFRVLLLNSPEADLVVVDIRVYVFVPPHPPHAIVEGCKHDGRCILDVNVEGNLTCSIRRIRPEAKVQWVPYLENVPTYISFFDEQETSIQRGGTFDLSVTAHFAIKNTTRKIFPVVCRVTGWDNTTVILEENVELIFDRKPVQGNDKEGTSTPRPKGIPWKVLIVAVVSLVLIVLIICSLVFYKRGKSSDRKQITTKEEGDPAGSEEVLELLRKKTTDDTELEQQTIKKKQNKEISQKPEVKDKRANKKRELFEKRLVSEYKALYTVSPVPLVANPKTGINNFFVKSSLKLSRNQSSNEESSLEKLESHDEIFQKKFTKTRRLILKGDHGCGKSTLTLQMAYEWCKERKSTYMKDYDVFILLDMATLNGGSSFSEAIKSIFFKNVEVEIIDIEEIIKSYASGLVVLDNFDKIIPRDKENVSKIAEIVTCEIPKQFQVVLITTLEYTPSDINIDTPQLMLKGFEEQHQNDYIDKNAKKTMKDFKNQMRKKFQANPLLDELCKVPLFFAVYVYICGLENNAVDSVTSLFTKVMELTSVKQHGKGKAEQEEEGKGSDKLPEVAFVSFLSSSGSEKRWEAQSLRDELGKDTFDYYRDVGLLVTDVIINGRERMKLRHRILMEWYAAFHPDIVKTIVSKESPPVSEHVVCFACANVKESKNRVTGTIISKSKVRKGIDMIYLELEKALPNQDIFKGLVVTFEANDTEEEVQSLLSTLEIATKYKQGEIDEITLKNCVKLKECSSEHITLKSGKKIRTFETLKHLKLEIGNEEFKGAKNHPILDYVVTCKGLKSLRFSSCFLAGDFTGFMIQKLESNKVSVEWEPDKGRILDLNYKKKEWVLRRNQALTLRIEVGYNKNDKILKGI